MTTRRDLLKLASALGLAGTVPTTAERIAAAQLLGGETSQRVMLDPATFASDMHHSLGNSGDQQFDNDWYGVLCPEETAEYVKMRGQLEIIGRDAGIDLVRVVGDYDAAAVSLNLAMYSAGLRHGAAYENLRRSLVGETVGCTDCWNTGVPYDKATGRLHRNGTCRTCGGTGTVAMRKG